jgi:hypothetical protein
MADVSLETGKLPMLDEFCLLMIHWWPQLTDPQKHSALNFIHWMSSGLLSSSGAGLAACRGKRQIPDCSEQSCNAFLLHSSTVQARGKELGWLRLFGDLSYIVYMFEIVWIKSYKNRRVMFSFFGNVIY